MKVTSKLTRRTEGAPSTGRQGTAAARSRGFAAGFESTDRLEAERELSQPRMDS